LCDYKCDAIRRLNAFADGWTRVAAIQYAAMTRSSDNTTLFVTIGDRVLPLVGGQLRTSIHELPSADIVVDKGDVAASPVDYLQPVRIGPEDGQSAWEGSVLDAQPTDAGVELRCGGGVSLTETLMPTGVAQGCSHIELVYSAARGAGFDEDHLVISGLDDLPAEAIEVAVPLVGIDVEAETPIGPVQLLPADAAGAIVTRFDPRPDLADEFESGSAIARAYVVAARLYDAELGGLAQIETVLSWLTVRANYGSAVLPNGELQRFNRANAIARCRRLPVVSVCAMAHTRRWLRRPTSDRVEKRIGLNRESQLERPAIPASLPASDANSIEAARRAIEPGDIVQRVHALWEAFEFDVGAKAPPTLFSRDDRHAILDTVQSLLSADQLERLSKMVNGPLNDTPLMDKLLSTLAAEGVAVSAAEEKALRRLRRVRGRTSHGSADAPTPDEMQYGCCVLARALTVRLHSIQ
jgi:hypothetical protein